MNNISSISHQGRLAGKLSLILLAAILFAFEPNTHGQAMAASRGAAPGMAMPKAGMELLQFTAGGHVLGFGDAGVYVAAGDHAFRTGFAGARRVRPQARGGSQGASSKAPPLERVTYRDLWDGVTLVYDRVPGGIVRSTWRIAPHARGDDPVRRIRLTYNAAVAIDKNGNLVLGFETGKMVKSAPVAWQEIGGKRVPVDVSFTILAGKESGFHVGAYDPAYPLVIDPTLTWHTFLGGAAHDVGYGIAVDAAGNVYVTGESFATWGTPVRAYGGGLDDAFAAKLDNAGGLVWNTFLGGAGTDSGRGIAVDAAGNVYVTGSSDATWGAPVQAFGGGLDAFAARLDNTGGLVWNTFLGGAGSDAGYGIAVDAAGNVYVAGRSRATWGTPVRAFGGGFGDAFAARLNNAGVLQWNTFLGGAGSDLGGGLAVDAAGNVYVAGSSSATWGAPVQAFGGLSDAFAAKLNNTGGLVWNTFLGGAGGDDGFGIAVDAAGNVYVTGESDATWGTPVRAFGGGGGDAFAAMIAATVAPPPPPPCTYALTLNGPTFRTGDLLTLGAFVTPWPGHPWRMPT